VRQRPRGGEIAGCRFERSGKGSCGNWRTRTRSVAVAFSFASFHTVFILHNLWTFSFQTDQNTAGLAGRGRFIGLSGRRELYPDTGSGAKAFFVGDGWKPPIFSRGSGAFWRTGRILCRARAPTSPKSYKLSSAAKADFYGVANMGAEALTS
jgi:hypothetical protein